jgi:hypothetical protein
MSLAYLIYCFGSGAALGLYAARHKWPLRLLLLATLGLTIFNAILVAPLFN